MKPGETLEVGPHEKITCVQSGAAGGPFVFDMELGPGVSGPPMHSHDEGDETVEVTSGEIVFKVGRRTHHLRAGDRLTLATDDIHTFYNPSKTDAVCCRVTHGSRFEKAIVHTRFPDLAYYLTHVDPGASRMASPLVRMLLRVIALFARVPSAEGQRAA